MESLHFRRKGGQGVLTIKGEVPCDYCAGDIKTMATHLDLDSLTVMHPVGMFHFDADALRTIKKGGSGWPDALIDTLENK